VSDNGVGGAHLAKGHGLAGLADRVSAAGGRLLVDSLCDSDSPAGSGTVIIAELPL
jgi:signal transduction histidine kinase